MSTLAPSMVEGLGDEVLLFLFTIVVGLVVILAWWSTHVRETPRVEAVLVQPLRSGVVVAEGIEPSEAFRRRNEGEIVFANPDMEEDEPEMETETEDVSGDDPVSLAEDGEDCATTEESVRIKLKFLNDSQREVTAPLNEKLGRFKRRHFADDLAENKTIRLIFNGHVLNGDREPLSSYGLFDNCVVHCVISRNRQEDPSSQHQAPAGSRETRRDDEFDGLDLSHLCYPLLGSVLVIIWWCQLMYSHYFSIASSLSLVSLTVLFLASVTNTYISQWCLKFGRIHDMSAINDPLRQTHCPASILIWKLFCFARFWNEQTDGSTDTSCENSDHYRSWLWVYLVDQ